VIAEVQRVLLWRKLLKENIEIAVEREKLTPALYLVIRHHDELVFESQPFFTRKSLRLNDSIIDKIQVELEKRGVAFYKIATITEWQKALEEAKRIVPEKPIMPLIEETGLTPQLVTVEELARNAVPYLFKPVEVHAVIAGKSEIIFVPVAIEEEDKETKDTILKVFNLEDPDLSLKVMSIWKKEKIIDYTSLFVLRLQDPAGFEKFTCLAVGCDIPKSRRIIVRGIVVANKQSRFIKPMLLATEIDTENEVLDKFEVNIEALKEIESLKPSSYEDLKDKIDLTIAPDIVGRKFEKLAAAITQASPLEIFYGDKSIQGTLRTVFFGDTGTAKSSIGKYLPDVLNLGVYATAETGSRAGLLYTVETSMEPPIVIWGQLVLADKEFACLDGLDKMHSEEWKEFRESLVQSKVVVFKRAKGEAPFRIRLIACANPTHKMNEYAFPIEALKDIRPFGGRDSGASIRRFDLFIPFCDNDVSYEDIAESYLRAKRNYELEEKYRKFLLIAWSAKAVFEEKALEKCIELAKQIMFYARSLDIPAIHNAYTEVVLKVAAGFAALLQNFSIDNRGLILTVDEQAVEYARLFFEEYLGRLGVEDYSTTLSSVANEKEIEQLLLDLENDSQLKKAVILLYKQGLSKKMLGQKLGIRDHNKQQRLVDRLVEKNLAISRRGVGVYLTKLGSRIAAELIRQKNEEKNSFLEDKRKSSSAVDSLSEKQTISPVELSKNQTIIQNSQNVISKIEDSLAKSEEQSLLLKDSLVSQQTNDSRLRFSNDHRITYEIHVFLKNKGVVLQRELEQYLLEKGFDKESIKEAVLSLVKSGKIKEKTTSENERLVWWSG